MLRVAVLIATLTLALALPFDPQPDKTTKVLPPLKGKSGSTIGIVMIQGAMIDQTAYEPLINKIQASSDLSIWATFPSFALNTPDPLTFQKVLDGGINALKSAGFDGSAPLVFIGHSLGGAVVQEYCATASDCHAQILLGSGLNRKYHNVTYPVSTLTVAGTLDGLYRITRVAELYYHQILHPMNSPDDFPIVAFEGLSHLQFASGSPPPLVKARDLKPEISTDDAHDLISSAISAFLSAKTSPSAQTTLNNLVGKTGEILMPIIEALEQEAYPNFKPPCNSDKELPSYCPYYPAWPGNGSIIMPVGASDDPPQKDCTCGTPWSQTVSQKAIGGLAGVQFVVTDAVHHVTDIKPVHLPHIWQNCTSEIGCTLNITTVTQPIYEKMDQKYDTGFEPVAATELRAKLMSRQAIWTAVGRQNVDFHETDEVPNMCGDINQMAVDYARSLASPAALARFDAIGQKMVFGKDVVHNSGPTWIWTPLKYEDSKDKTELLVTSCASYYTLDCFVKSARGFHYCKLLSPARALEWIYVDGLRARGSLSS